MARKKQKRSSAHARTSTSNPRIPRASKPKLTQEIIAVESENEEQPRLSGVLRGLDTRNVLSPTMQPTVEQSDDTNYKPENRYGTRASRHGRSQVSYDQKFHPMDVVTRPKLTARRQSGSRSLSASVLRDDRSETPEDSLPSSARASDSDESEDSEPGPIEMAARQPDPRASRHSERSTATQFVNYSNKHHPQDLFLPGFQHKARQMYRDPAHDSGEAKHAARPRKRKVRSSNSDHESSRSKSKRKISAKDDSTDVDDLVEGAIQGSQFQMVVSETGTDMAVYPLISQVARDQAKDLADVDFPDIPEIPDFADEDPAEDLERVWTLSESTMEHEAMHSSSDNHSSSGTHFEAGPHNTTEQNTAVESGAHNRPHGDENLRAQHHESSSIHEEIKASTAIVISSAKTDKSSKCRSSEASELRDAQSASELHYKQHMEAEDTNQSDLIESYNSSQNPSRAAIGGMESPDEHNLPEDERQPPPADFFAIGTMIFKDDDAPEPPCRKSDGMKSTGDDYEFESHFDEQFSGIVTDDSTDETGAQPHRGENQYPSPVTTFNQTAREPQRDNVTGPSFPVADASQIKDSRSTSSHTLRSGEKTHTSSPDHSSLWFSDQQCSQVASMQ